MCSRAVEWLSENWIFVLIAVAFVALHLFGHGGGMEGMGDTRATRGVVLERATPIGIDENR